MGKKELTISWKTLMRIAITVLIVFLCIYYWGGFERILTILFSSLGAIMTGMVIAYIINIPMRFYERVLPGKKGDGTPNRIGALVLAVLSIALVLVFLGVGVIPQLITAFIALGQESTVLIGWVLSQDFIASLIPENIKTLLENADWNAILGMAATWLRNGVAQYLPQISSVAAGLGVLGMGFLFAMWFLGDKIKLGEEMHRLIRAYISDSADEKFTAGIALADDCFRRYFTAQLLEASILGSLVFLGMTVVGVPYAPMVGALVGIMSLIPMIGALIGAILGGIIILAESWQQALVFAIVFVVVQQIEANFIYYRVVGKRVGLYGLWPLVGVTLGMAFFGMPGAFAGVPSTALIYRIVQGDLERREALPEDALTPIESLKESLKD